ncbi:MAG: ABC transporter ATP-binding protein [Bacillota bacterium]|nr:ABC transporter ATP-binding protein [Bacillota bacterium]
MYRHISPFLRKNIGRYVLGILVLIFVDLLQLLVPQMLKTFTDHLVGQDVTVMSIMHYAIALLMIAIGIGISRFLWRILIVLTALNFEAWLRSKFFRHLLTQPRKFFYQFKTGDLMANATNDINALREASSGGIIMIIDAVFLTISTVIVMIRSIDFGMTMLAIIPLPIIMITVTFFTKKLFRYSRSVQQGFGALSEKVQESFSGIRVIKSFAQEDEQLDDFNAKSKDYLERNLRLVRTRAILQPLITFISTLSTIIALVIGSRYVIEGRISLGSFVAFINYLELLTWPMMAFGFFIAIIQSGAASLDRLNHVFDRTSDLIDSEITQQPKDSSIEIRDLSFTYPGAEVPALRHIDLYVPDGSSLGILGRTGSGKSTLVSLLMRLYNVEPGTIRIGGVDLLDLSIAQTREMIGAVPQDLFLFSTTIRDNIALSAGEPDDLKIVASAQTAHIDREIRDFPQGYDTFLGEKGVNLSGGQKQRTSIARMIYKDARIMILDDSLSAVDTITETAILSHLRERIDGRTAIIVSHRISTLKDLDHIIVMDEGSIIERGTHDELLAAEGVYFDIYNKQKLEEQILAK